MSMAQYRNLLYLMAGARRASELASASDVTKPTVSAMLSSLRQQGWVTERADPTDGRVTNIIVTPAGLARVRAFEAELAERMDELLPGVDRDEARRSLETLYAAHATTREERLGGVFKVRPAREEG